MTVPVSGTNDSEDEKPVPGRDRNKSEKENKFAKKQTVRECDTIENEKTVLEGNLYDRDDGEIVTRSDADEVENEKTVFESVATDSKDVKDRF